MKYILLLALNLAFFKATNAQTIWIYQNKDFCGKALEFNGSLSYIGDSMNDLASSIKVPNGFTVILYEHKDFQGRQVKFTSSNNDFDLIRNEYGFKLIQDQASSVKVFDASGQEVIGGIIKSHRDNCKDDFKPIKDGGHKG